MTAPISDRTQSAVEHLRALGWTLIPPLPAGLPQPAAGQVWHSTKPGSKIKPRTVLKVGAHRAYSWDGDNCVYFSAAGDDPRPKYPRVLSSDGWRSWVSNSLARPVTP